MDYHGVVFADAAFDLDRIEVGIWGRFFGGQVLHCSAPVCT